MRNLEIYSDVVEDLSILGCCGVSYSSRWFEGWYCFHQKVHDFREGTAWP